ncbi:MAG: sodium/proline symporter [Candidatus Methanofastidiosia archaeon]|jgi:sodium/proline symporter
MEFLTMVGIGIGCYLVVMLLIGYYSYKRAGKTVGDYLLAGRTLGPFVSALTLQASWQSGYLFMAMPARGWSIGFGASWLSLVSSGSPLGNWLMIAKRLRNVTEKLDALTLPDYFEGRFKDNTHMVRVVTLAPIVVFMTAYMGTQLVATGRLFESIFGWNYMYAMYLGAFIILAYSIAGGFYAVAYTDVVQGVLMWLVMLLVPIIAIIKIGGIGTFISGLEAIGSGELVSPYAIGGLLICNYLFQFFGTFGQPHQAVRYMAIKSSKEVRMAQLTSTIWAVVALYGAILIGMQARILTPGLANPESALFEMSKVLFHPIIVGVIMAGVLAAIMSSADSQLLSASSAISRDIIEKIFMKGKELDEKTLVIISRLSVLGLGIFALLYATFAQETLFKLILFAWGGLAATLSMPVLISLYWKRTTKWGVISGVIVGMVTLVYWKQAGLSWNPWWEGVPAIIACTIALVVVSLITRQPPDDVTEIVDFGAGKLKAVSGGSAEPGARGLDQALSSVDFTAVKMHRVNQLITS